MDGDNLLLDHIENSSNDDTTQLLDLLERETQQSGPLSRGVGVVISSPTKKKTSKVVDNASVNVKPLVVDVAFIFNLSI